MEPQNPKNARNANANQARPVKGIGGLGTAKVEQDPSGIALVLEREGREVFVGFHPGAALKLAEQIIHAARRQMIPDRAPLPKGA